MVVERSCGPAWLDAKLSAGKVVIVDGATGTELQARGVPMDKSAWSGPAALGHPEILREIHADYIRAGAEVIITNTFASARHMLEPAGFADEVADANRRAVALALEARDEAAARPVAVAGSICDWHPADSRFARPVDLAASLSEQAQILAEAGVDLIALEMCQTRPGSAQAVEAALETGLPVWLGMSARQRPTDAAPVTFDPPHLDFEEILAELAAARVALVNVMHSPIEVTGACLEIARSHWAGPLGAYPESGYFEMPNWHFVEVISPPDLVREAKAWIAGGAQLLGGCCGLGPAHVAALSAAYGAG